MLSNPTHSSASTYVRSGIFRDAVSFAEIERRIEALPTEQERGAAFEVFTEAYLATETIAQAKQVWVVGKVPDDICKRLNLPRADYGYDGVIETHDGELVTYQAKFRTARVSLPYADLATFFGISEQADRRLVVTNSVSISAVAESRIGFQSMRGTDLDRVDIAQLKAINDWLDHRPIERRVRTPRPHQHNALSHIRQALEQRDRATVVMACGTGKTLVALWATEEFKPKRVLVLLPSLNLLRQTLHEWAKWTTWGEQFRYLCVCSDSTVAAGIDEITLRDEEVDFPVVSNSAVLKRFLTRPNEGQVQVVFSTYHSAKIVAEAMDETVSFDVGIFDEAHKTTGREGALFSFALFDKNLAIKKRLFLTATPRKYQIRTATTEDELPLLSMDDADTYGEVAYKLSFREAVERKIILPYKVVISVINSTQINSQLIENAETEVDGVRIDAKWVADQLALKEAVQRYGVRKAITFHSRVSHAALFASDGTQGIGTFLPEYPRFHISGKQSTAQREPTLRGFFNSPKGIITNARCLTEGVDVPSVDMVAFMAPRRSRVDIVQAVGRAMRVADEAKTVGYVLVPIYLNIKEGETISEAIGRSGYEEILIVLNAMRENDDSLEDYIENVAVERGRQGSYDDASLDDYLDVIGDSINLDELKRSITTNVLEHLSSTWDERYGQLQALKEQYGTCNVPVHVHEDKQLSAWCYTQLKIYNSGTMLPERERKLHALGFFNQIEQKNNWPSMYDQLKKYKAFHGTCDIDPQWQQDSELIDWLKEQVAAYELGELPVHRVNALRELGLLMTDRLRPIVDFVLQRKSIFANGIVGAPLSAYCNRLVHDLREVLPGGARIPESALIQSLVRAGWLDKGDLAVGIATAAKRVFCAPEMAELDDMKLIELLQQTSEQFEVVEHAVAELNANRLVELIRERQWVFEKGIVASPFHKILGLLRGSSGGSKSLGLGLDELLDALNKAGWIDAGRISSAEYTTKKQIFYSPELKHLRKSDLRRLAERFDLEGYEPLKIQARSGIQAAVNIFGSIGFTEEIYGWLLSQIQSRNHVFSNGLVFSPFDSLWNELQGHTDVFKLPELSPYVRDKLFDALRRCGWIDAGRISSAEYTTKKQIIHAPELSRLKKSELRRMVEQIEDAKLKAEQDRQ